MPTLIATDLGNVKFNVKISCKFVYKVVVSILGYQHRNFTVIFFLSRTAMIFAEVLPGSFTCLPTRPHISQIMHSFRHYHVSCTNWFFFIWDLDDDPHCDDFWIFSTFLYERNEENSTLTGFLPTIMPYEYASARFMLECPHDVSTSCSFLARRSLQNAGI